MLLVLTDDSSQKLVEFSAPSQWTFDMGWCERNPYLVASSAFSGKLSVFSLFGGQEDIPEQTPRVCKVPTRYDQLYIYGIFEISEIKSSW